MSAGALKSFMVLDSKMFLDPLKQAERESARTAKKMERDAARSADAARRAQQITAREQRFAAAKVRADWGPIEQQAQATQKLERQTTILDRAQQSASKSLQRWATNVNLARAATIGIGSAIAIAIKATREYAQINSQTGRDVQRIGQNIKGTWQDIGRTIAPAVSMFADGASAVRSFLTALGEGTQGRVLNNALRTQEQIGFEIARQREFQEQLTAQQAEQLRLLGDIQGAETIIAQVSERESKRRLAALKDEGRISAQQYDALLAGIENTTRLEMQGIRTREKERRDAVKKAEEDAAQAAADEAQRERERAERDAEDARRDAKRRDMAVIGLGFDRESAEIELMRLNGMRQEADIRRIILDYKQTEASINANELLTDAQREEHLRAMADIRDRELEIVRQTRAEEKAARNETRSIQAGLAVGGLVRAALGAGTNAMARPIERQQLGELKSMNRTLKNIERGSNVATFAP